MGPHRHTENLENWAVMDAMERNSDKHLEFSVDDLVQICLHANGSLLNPRSTTMEVVKEIEGQVKDLSQKGWITKRFSSSGEPGATGDHMYGLVPEYFGKVSWLALNEAKERQTCVMFPTKYKPKILLQDAVKFKPACNAQPDVIPFEDVMAAQKAVQPFVSVTHDKTSSEIIVEVSRNMPKVDIVATQAEEHTSSAEKGAQKLSANAVEASPSAPGSFTRYSLEPCLPVEELKSQILSIQKQDRYTTYDGRVKCETPDSVGTPCPKYIRIEDSVDNGAGGKCCHSHITGAKKPELKDVYGKVTTPEKYAEAILETKRTLAKSKLETLAQFAVAAITDLTNESSVIYKCFEQPSRPIVSKIAEFLEEAFMTDTFYHVLDTWSNVEGVISGLTFSDRLQGKNFMQSKEIELLVEHIRDATAPFLQCCRKIRKLDMQIEKLKNVLVMEAATQVMPSPISAKKSDKGKQKEVTILPRPKQSESGTSSGIPAASKQTKPLVVKPTDSTTASSPKADGTRKPKTGPTSDKKATAKSKGPSQPSLLLPKTPAELQKMLKDAELKGQKQLQVPKQVGNPVASHNTVPCEHCHKLNHKATNCFFNPQSPQYKGRPSLLSMRKKSEEVRFGEAKMPSQNPNSTGSQTGGRFVSPQTMHAGFSRGSVPILFNAQNHGPVPKMTLIDLNGTLTFVPTSMVGNM